MKMFLNEQFWCFFYGHDFSTLGDQKYCHLSDIKLKIKSKQAGAELGQAQYKIGSHGKFLGPPL